MLRRAVVLIGAVVLIAGMAAPASAATRPAAPALTVAPANGAVLARWSAPPPSGAAVTAYQVAHRTYRPVLKTWTAWTYVPVGPTVRSRKILAANGALLQVRVRAFNRLGAGAWSRSLAQRAGVPAAVPGVTVTPGDGLLRLSWSTPATNGSSLTGFRIARRALVAGAWSGWTYVEVSGSSRAAKLTGLVNGRSYQVQVAAKNARGFGPYSAAVTARPVAPPPPPPPTVTMVESVLPEVNGALYTEENEGRGYVGFVVTAAADGKGEVTITLPTVAYVANNPYSPGAVTTTFQTVQTTDPNAFGFISTTNTSCRSALISRFTPSLGVGPQPITVSYDCPAGGQLLLNVYPQLGWRGVNDENPQFQQPDPNDVYTFPVSATAGGLTRVLPSPTLEVVSYPIVLGSVPDQLNYTRPILLTDVGVADSVVTFTGFGSDANNIPFTNTITFSGGVFVDGSGNVLEGITPLIAEPAALLTGRRIVATPLEFTDCAAFGCPPTTVGAVEITDGAGITTSTGASPPASRTFWWANAYGLEYFENLVNFRQLCAAYGAVDSTAGSIDSTDAWTCGGWPDRTPADLMLPKVGPLYCTTQDVIVSEKPTGWYVTCLNWD